MSGGEQGEGRLVDEAIDLAIRLQNDPDNPVAVEMVQSWRARSDAHERLWTRMARIDGAVGRVLTDRRRSERRESLGLTRRNFMVGAVGIGAAGAGYAFVPDLMTRIRADHVTAKGEIQRIVLDDGSHVTLGPGSALAARVTAQDRQAELMAGMAFFEAAPDPQRPFTIATGVLTATAVGAACDVSSDAGFITIAVESGTVDLRLPARGGETAMRVDAGEWLTFDASSGKTERGRMEARQVASWRNGFIAAESEPVAALVARIGRWVPGRVMMADSSIGSQRVSGFFDLSDPVRALEAVASPAKARVRRVSNFLTVISAI